MKATITKLQRRKDPENKTAPLVYDGESFIGIYEIPPKVGRSFYLKTSPAGWIQTSVVRSVFVQDTNQDKLVLPEDFPDALHLDTSNVKLLPGEMLVATMNSLYKLTDIKNDNI